MRSVFLMVSLAVLLGGRAVRGQECPRENPDGPPVESAPRALTGRVVVHDALRQWEELRLDAPICGTTAIQLVSSSPTEAWDRDYRNFQTMDGCMVTVRGVLQIPLTGYFSAPLYLPVDSILPSRECVRKLPLPDYSKLKPEASLRGYSVDMTIHYQREGHVDARVLHDGRQLGPWQKYARYELTGGFALYAYCGKGFTMTRLSGTPAGKPWIVDGYGAFDPETAAEKGLRTMHLRYTCRRDTVSSRGRGGTRR